MREICHLQIQAVYNFENSFWLDFDELEEDKTPYGFVTENP